MTVISSLNFIYIVIYVSYPSMTYDVKNFYIVAALILLIYLIYNCKLFLLVFNLTHYTSNCNHVVISRHYADLLHKKDSVQASEKSYQQLHQRKLYACKKDNAKLNKSLGQLKSTVRDTMELYKQTEGEVNCYGDNKPLQQSPFLSAYSLDSYHSIEGKFTQSLVAYTKKQFFQV